MKTRSIGFAFSLLGLLLLCNACRRGNMMVVNNGDYKISVRYDGEIEISDDETDFESISPRGYIKYNKNGSRMYAEGNNHGDVSYELSINGHDVDPDSQEGKTFIALAIKDMIDIGFDAEGRMQRLYKKGGKEALLTAVDKLHGDYIKRMYLEWLLENTDLSDEEMIVIANKTERQIESAYDKSTVLSNHSEKFFRDSAVIGAWLAAVSTIHSDYDKANALKRIMEEQLPRNQMKAALLSASTVESDYDKAGIIRTALEHNSYSKEDYDDMVKAISSVNSSYDKKELLKELVKEDIPSGESFNGLMKCLNKVDGDYDKREVLMELASKNISSEEDWTAFLQTTSKLQSEYDKAEVMVECAKHIPRTDAMRDAYADAANSIKGEYDYGRVMQAWRR